MRNTTMIVFLLAGLFVIGVQSSLPNENQIANMYTGEGVNCDGTFVNINSDPSTVIESEEGVVTAVAQAVAQAINMITANPSTATVVAEANAAAELVLEVVARAVATVTAEINSPNPGCWAIAFGKAEAVAVAKATVTAIADAFAEAQAQGRIAQVVAQVQNAEIDVEVAVEEIALLLADGSGSGRKSDKAVVEAVARATAVNCALAQAFAAVAEGVTEAEVFAQVGCFPPQSSSDSSSIASSRSMPSPSSDCDCIDGNNQGAPNQCGLWGQQGYKTDYICYVKDPSKCRCALPSSIYCGMAWRYCGPTMKEMQKLLSITDEKNKIFSKPSGDGYCAKLNHNNDKISKAQYNTPATLTTCYAPTTPQTPTPTPTVSNCPRFRCIGDAGRCCSKSGPTCTSRIGRKFDYLGKCASGQDVWSGFIECYCP